MVYGCVGGTYFDCSHGIERGRSGAEVYARYQPSFWDARGVVVKDADEKRTLSHRGCGITHVEYTFGKDLGHTHDLIRRSRLVHNSPHTRHLSVA